MSNFALAGFQDYIIIYDDTHASRSDEAV